MPAVAAEPATLPAISLLFVGNEGFLARIDDTAVLFDAVLGRGLPEYPAPSREDRQRIEHGEPPFDGVIVAFASHHHADHFDAAAAVRFLDGHDDAHFVTTAQAVRRIDRRAAVRLADRIHGFAPPVELPAQLEIGSVAIRAFTMHHGRGGAQNLGFLVTIAGRRLLHVGDTQISAEELAALPVAQPDRPVDVAMIPYWLLAQDAWVEQLSVTFAPRQVAVIHLPKKLSPALLAPLRDRFGAEAIFADPETLRVFQPDL